MSLNWRDKILLLKTETTYGVDSTPTGAANAMLVTNISLNPMEGQDVSRELDKAGFGADATIPTELHYRLQFEIELAPSGAAGTPPAWGPALRACGVAEVISAGTSVTYNPITDGQESVTIYLYIDSTLYQMVGTRGTVTMDFTAQSVPKLKFDMRGLFVKPAEGVRPTPDQSAFQKPQLVTSTNTPNFTIGGTAFVMKDAMLNLNNQVEGRFLVGSEEIKITERGDSFETTVDAVALTTFDPFQAALDQTTFVVNLVHGTGAGRIATLNMPSVQMQRVQGLANSQNVKEWPLRMVPLPSATGNDQWTLTLT